MEYLSEGPWRLPDVLQRIVESYLKSLETYRWYATLLIDFRTTGDLSLLHLMSSDRLLAHLSVFLEDGHQEVVDPLLQKYYPWWDNNTLVKEAAERGHLEVLKYLISRGDYYPEQALERAAQGGHLEIIKYLVSLGVTYFDDAIYKAALEHHAEVIKYLASLENSPRGSFLTHAANAGNWYAIERLVAPWKYQ